MNKLFIKESIASEELIQDLKNLKSQNGFSELDVKFELEKYQLNYQVDDLGNISVFADDVDGAYVEVE